ncbi:GNAT family N-acetyltransferase [Nocardioides mesophilus]|uniref:GNAT family N-acetyltransferase n=1 Tax=Nocardioides mesophilus TaxID=433659 RepID=A0A7G9RFE0_9ACTN|nr:GNAT family N-acetyltransferase [Nocardioides mesophilus]QNN54315.1 GNAT family N-acetyltransferase [Nocardioides mesophilus]
MFRDATLEDLAALRDLERESNLAALGHVFPADRFPFPDDAVLARWSLVLDEPGCEVLVLDDPEPSRSRSRLIAYAAYDDSWLRHLAVRPDHWGEGLASSAIDTALHAMDLRGSTSASLWCLEENRRARRLYEYLGWRPTEDRQPAPWPPHPTEMRYERLIVASTR